MFDYIVSKINRAIANKEEMNKINKNNIYKIGLLDIFGICLNWNMLNKIIKKLFENKRKNKKQTK